VIWGYLIFSVGMLLAVFGFIWINQVPDRAGGAMQGAPL
jgi:hypothetical protein